MEEMAPGYRFYPTEEELISFYLHNKLRGTRDDINRVIPRLDIYQHEPPQLPKHYGELCNGDSSDEQWFFFVPRNEREVRGGGRCTRTTTKGYWKATGSPSYVYSSATSKVIGVKKSMVFYTGKAPTGSKTQWKMNEYKAIEQDLPSSTPKLRHELSLCRVYVGSGTVRAFDRRPVSDIEISTSKKRKKIHENDGCGSSSINRENATSDSPDLPQANQSGEDDERNMEDINEEEINNLEVFSGLANIMDLM